MNVYSMFSTKEDYEVNGFWLDYGDFRVRLARSGGRNTLYAKTFDKELKNINKANFKSLTEQEALDVLTGVFARSVIKDMEVKDEKGNWKKGLYLKTDKGVEVVPFNVRNAKQILIDLPDFFAELQNKASDFTQFQEEVVEEQVKN